MLTEAVKLCYDARKGGVGYGAPVSWTARQYELFADVDGLKTAADMNNAAMLMLADVLNDKRVTMLKNVFMMYNDDARLSASGQMDIFSGGVPSREEILKNVIKRYSDANKKQIEAARRAAVERRKTESAEQAGTPPKSGGTGGQGKTPAANGHAPAGEGEPAPVGEETRRPSVHLTEEQEDCAIYWKSM